MWIFTAVLGILAFIYGQVDVAVDSIRFDLHKIGESIYEAHSRHGAWPAKIADLEGTTYLNMPYRKQTLEQNVFQIVWAKDLDSNPQLNRDRVLAFSNGGLLARLGFVWACRGDLRIERIRTQEIESHIRHSLP
jgi:hypothetical protein